MADDLERIAAEKAAVAALRGSTKAIETVLERNRQLEAALKAAAENLRTAKNYVGPHAYLFHANNSSESSSKKITDVLESQAQAAFKLVG
jgi:hypothetical protein